MALEVTPVYRNLLARPTFLWLEFEDWFLVIGLAATLNLGGRLVNRMILGLPLNLFLQFAVPVLAIPALLLFKYGKPRGYLSDLFWWHAKPRTYCGFERDREQTGEYLREEDGDAHHLA